MIEVQGLRKKFGQVNAANGVSFIASDGEVTGLLGPNGAGKTTSMRMIYGLAHPDGGSVWIDGRDCTSNPVEVARRLGVLPDSRGLYPRLTTREHLRYFGELHGLSSPSLDRRVVETIGQLEMERIADRRVQGFSQGERVKVALARALMHDPRNILMDEPSNGLDVMSTRVLRSLILRLKRAGKCVLFSSHVMQEVAAVCDRIVVIAGGRVVGSGTTDEIVRNSGKSTLEDAFVELTGSREEFIEI
ncbi:MAG TPA: ATP-binding cassette domain-containing protein [Candidatus Acidoferrum sp.]|jgi:sodium transport system ATP-binding protein